MGDIIERLRSELPSLPSKLAVAAAFAVDNPQLVALSSMRSVATSCGVASPTMLRLARHMGFESYNDFKEGMQREVFADSFGARAGALHKVSAPEGEHEALLEQIGEAAADNLRETISGCDPEQLAEMARTLLRAQTTYVLGAGSMHSVAMLFQSTGRMVLPGLRVPRSGDASTIETIGAIGEGDAVLALAVSPYARSTLDAIRFAGERGATVMAITDRRSSPLLQYAKLALLGSTTSPHYYPSYVSIICLAEILLATVVVEGGDDALQRVELIEQLRERSGAYLS